MPLRVPFFPNTRVARELERSVREVRSRFGFGGPDDGPVAVEEDAGEFAGGDVSTLLGVLDGKGAFWGNGEMDAVDE